ncbi:hypothetical protein [Paenibacillus sp. SYP-B4298]|uniref:hypothetical protein n=1 Tax=Paenibacillus sp. SYP-B4298 TaxID=2996034 RepID=UPI0022DD2D3B|nr:hypothetical protein [Paenibacillus sp. SYP-B4298]
MNWQRQAMMILLSVALAVCIMPAPAHAGWFDRIRDIYTAPDKLEEVQESYDSLIGTMQQQQEELEAARKEALETSSRLAEEQRRWIEENEQLEKRNRELAERLSQLELQEQNRSQLLRNTLTVSATIVGVLALAFIGMRVIRILIWRRGKRSF